jgi:hypothetical protein
MNQRLGHHFTALKNRAHRAVAILSDEQGDVPGWVLITLMTAGIVVALWAVASPALGQLFNTAITRVVSF